MNVLVSTAPIRTAEGQIKNVIEMSTNITQIRQLQSQLTSLGLVISSISHGIKGLLTSLDGGIYLVNSGMEKNNPERIKQGWQMVERNIARVRTMVLDLLYYAKDRELALEWFPAESVLEEVSGVIRGKAKDHGIEVRSDIDPMAGDLAADRKAIRSLLVNLTENALDACRVDQEEERALDPTGGPGIPGCGRVRSRPTTASAWIRRPGKKPSACFFLPRRGTGPAWACLSPTKSFRRTEERSNWNRN